MSRSSINEGSRCARQENHGASKRSNPGERSVAIYRYGPSWSRTLHGYEYSDTLLERVTPAQRKILPPIAPQVAGVMRGLEA